MVYENYLSPDFPDAPRTKIVCTIGPASDSEEKLSQLVQAGMNVMRMNFSHGTYEYHKKTLETLRSCLSKMPQPTIVAVMLDIKGPKIRAGKLRNGQTFPLTSGQLFTFHTDQTVVGDGTKASVSYDGICASVKVGGKVLLDDGNISMEVVEVHENTVVCRVLNNGVIRERIGISLPGAKIDLPAITEKDKADIQFGIDVGVDFIAASFVRKASDVRVVRQVLGNSNIKVISKIETQEGIDNFDEILTETDGIMVARGDLGVEIPLEKMAFAQKTMIRKCNLAGKPVITATQMLNSMIEYPRPLRAETSDVANAVLDGSDCVMLSGESAIGKYPVEAVQVMRRICVSAEKALPYEEIQLKLRRSMVFPLPLTESIASSAVLASWSVYANAIIVVSESGTTARLTSKYRPVAPIIAITTSPLVARQCQLYHDVFPYCVESKARTQRQPYDVAVEYAKNRRWLTPGNPFVLTSGVSEQFVANSTSTVSILLCQ